MDLSLDDYMKSSPRTKKEKSSGVGGGGGGGGRSSLGGRRGRLGGRVGSGGMRRTLSAPLSTSKRLGVRNDDLRTKQSALSRLGTAGGLITKRNLNSDSNVNVRQQKFQTKTLAMDNERLPVSDPGNLKIVVTDARHKISRKPVQDARMKLKNKGGPAMADARSRITSKHQNVDKVVTVGRPNPTKTVTIGRNVADMNDNDEDDDQGWMKTIKNPTLTKPFNQGFGIHRVVNQDVPQIIRQDKTDLTIVRNFRPSLATFSVDTDTTYDYDRPEEDQFNVRITRKVPRSEPVYSLPDYSDLLKDTQRKLDAGHGDLYYGKMQADQEVTGTHARVHKVTTQRTNAVEAPIITFNNDKVSKLDPTGIIALPPRRKLPPPQPLRAAPQPLPPPCAPQQEEAMEVDSPVEMVSPLQGFRVTVTNLHPAVTQEDIIELFACIGPLKKARLVKKGSAEVVYVRKDDALAAVKRYHNRLLDNMPMSVKCVASAAQLKAASSSSSLTSKSKEPATPIDLDIEVVHKALFKNSKDQGAAQPVQFLVKI